MYNSHYMICIVGLGNPGEKYQNNRHNVGFMFVDYMVTLFSGHAVANRKIDATMYQCDNKILLAKPQIFMNKSGEVVRLIVKQYNLNPKTDLIIVHDDLDIPFGKFKIQTTGPKLHNGIESIENHLHTVDFFRVRIGVDARPSNDPTRSQQITNEDQMIPGETYVLRNFLLNEQKELSNFFSKIVSRLKNEFLFL